jgi:AGZA family xanthine/uracil permease-like MFS transporter
VLNAIFFAIVALFGLTGVVSALVPIEAGMAIVLWIGIVITAQAFSATPHHHAPAVVVGLLPGVVAWGALMSKIGLRVGGMGPPAGDPFDQHAAEILAGFDANSWNLHGALALEQGFILTAMVLAAMVAMVLERRFFAAAGWATAAAVLSMTGLMHGYRWTASDTAISLHPAWPWVVGYLCMAACFASAKWITTPTMKSEI